MAFNVLLNSWYRFGVGCQTPFTFRSQRQLPQPEFGTPANVNEDTHAHFVSMEMYPDDATHFEPRDSSSTLVPCITFQDDHKSPEGEPTAEPAVEPPHGNYHASRQDHSAGIQTPQTLLSTRATKPTLIGGRTPASFAARSFLALPRKLRSTLFPLFSGTVAVNVNPEPTGSAILDLPAEIRNSIFQLVLLQDEPVDLMDLANRTQPALLRVNRQLRREAICAYYTLNTFIYCVTDFNILWILPFKRLLHTYRASRFGSGTRIKLSGVPNWVNLKEWMRVFHANRDLKLGIAAEPKPGRGTEGRKAVLRGAVRILNVMADMPWAKVEEALEGYHQGLMACQRFGLDASCCLMR